MWQILRSYGIPQKIVNGIRCLYDNVSSRVQVDSQLSDPFTVSTGVLQGDTLAPFLFIIVLDHVLSQTPPHFGFVTHVNPEIRLTDLDFADDISLLDGSISDARNHIINLSENAAQVGLKINVDKTKLMTPLSTQNDIVLPDGSIIRQVDEFKYLGSMMSTSHADLNVRRGQAWSAFWSMKTLWRAKDVTLDLKIRIFKTTCLSILLYGSEAWSINKAMTSRINSFATSCYRYMLSIKRTDRVRNDAVMEKTGQIPLSVTVKQRQLSWLGHILRSDPEGIPRKYALYWPPHGQRKRGRPRLLYHKYIQDMTGHDSTDEIICAAQDRDGWRTAALLQSTSE